ncbi:MAG TPA: 3-phosphoshikimate 1-carboxyvinyltransferase [Acidobacteriota bacterium]|nr:3-phosphoshikimate 1-carboxyvinyltransferase [Acidobacteriota bacterium]
MRIEPAKNLQGEPRLPGDKSISHRYAILSAMAEGRGRLQNYSDSDDCAATLECVAALGAEVEQEGREVCVQGRGWKHWRQPKSPLQARNSGTLMRLLTGPLSGMPFDSVFEGDESLSGRPMERIMRPLSEMGGRIGSRPGGLPPLHIKGRELRGIRYSPPVASAQVKSCVLLAGLVAQGSTEVVEQTHTRDHTERCLPFFGADFASRQGVLRVAGGKPLKAVDFTVPGDFSAAVFFIVAALMVPGARLRIPQVGVNPSRSGLLDLLEQAQVKIERANPREYNGEPVCDLELKHQSHVLEHFPSQLRGRWIPNLIDEIPALAVLGTRLKAGFTVRDAEELRKKECDRIRAVTENLSALGVQCEEFPDGFHIPPGQQIQGGTVKTYGDHRIAMAFAVAGLIARQAVEIDDPSCAAVSFPGFFDNLKSLAR